MMKPASSSEPHADSLAGYLLAAARRTPAAPALIHGGRSWNYAAWADESAAPATGDGPLAVAGEAFELARGAAVASRQNRPFLPVDRSRPPPAGLTLPSEVALAIATSGSEGAPRLVRLGKRQLAAAAANANACLALHPGDAWLNCLPLYHIGGQSILWRCALAGATVLLHDGFDPVAIAADFARQPVSRISVSHISLVPAMLARLLDAGIRPPAGLRVALIGGAALSRPLYERGRAAGWPLYPSYGMSETAALVASWTPADGPWHAGLVGRPLPGHEFRIAGDGRIRIRGPQVMPDGGDDEGWLTTGDLGRLDDEGRLTVLGRADDMLVSGGRNIHPAEVESCLAGCPGVTDVAVTGLPDPVWGDLVVALVVGPAEPAALLAHARRQLPAAALPRRIRRIEQLPRNAAGKLERAALRRLAAEAEA